jgi:helix-turn-helix protein
MRDTWAQGIVATSDPLGRVVVTVEMPRARVRAVLDCLASGMNPMQASRASGVLKSFAYNLCNEMGGVVPAPEATCSARYLDREERYEIARLREARLPVRQVAIRLGRNPSTLSRELCRNATPAPGATSPSGRTPWPGGGGRSRRSCRVPRCCARRCRSSGHPLLSRAGQREADGVVPGDPEMRYVTRRSTSRSTSARVAN